MAAFPCLSHFGMWVCDGGRQAAASGLPTGPVRAVPAGLIQSRTAAPPLGFCPGAPDLALTFRLVHSLGVLHRAFINLRPGLQRALRSAHSAPMFHSSSSATLARRV